MKRPVEQPVEQPAVEQPVEQHYVNPVEGPVLKKKRASKKRASNLCPGCTLENGPFATKCAICEHKFTDCNTVEQDPRPPIWIF